MKINTATIEGFDAMTVEQKLAAVMGLEVPDPVDLSGFVKKDIFDAKASEAAAARKAIAEKQSAEERAEAERKELIDSLKSQVDSLTYEKNIADHKANFASLGYDETLASETAKALASGDMTAVFANQRKFIEARDKAIRADVLKDTPRPSGAGAVGNEKSDAVSLAESIANSRKSATELSRQTMNNYTGGKNSGI